MLIIIQSKLSLQFIPYTLQYLAKMAPEWPTCLHSKGPSIFFHVSRIAFFNLVQWFKLVWLVSLTHAFKGTHILWSKGLKLELEGGQQYLNQNWAIWMYKNICIDLTVWAGILSCGNTKLLLRNHFLLRQELQLPGSLDTSENLL